MPLSDTAFDAITNATLNRLAEMLEVYDEDGVLEVELLAGTLSAQLPSGGQFLINRHGPSRQIWLSSPLSGAMHFSYDEDEKEWVLPNGRKLEAVLRAEVETLLVSEE